MIRVSGIGEFFDLKDLQSKSFQIEPVNVFHINHDTPGKYSYSFFNAVGKFQILGSDFTGFRRGSKFKRTLFETQTTMFVLKGYYYKVISYLEDDSGKLVEQSSHELDYK